MLFQTQLHGGAGGTARVPREHSWAAVALPAWAGEALCSLTQAKCVVGQCVSQAGCVVFSDSVTVHFGDTEDEFRRPAVLKTVLMSCAFAESIGNSGKPIHANENDLREDLMKSSCVLGRAVRGHVTMLLLCH